MSSAQRPSMPPLSKAQERQRRISLLAMFVLGIGIGCVLVGLMLSAKRAMLTPAHPPAAAGSASPASGPPSTPTTTNSN